MNLKLKLYSLNRAYFKMKNLSHFLKLNRLNFKLVSVAWSNHNENVNYTLKLSNNSKMSLTACLGLNILLIFLFYSLKIKTFFQQFWNFLLIKLAPWWPCPRPSGYSSEQGLPKSRLNEQGLPKSRLNGQGLPKSRLNEL